MYGGFIYFYSIAGKLLWFYMNKKLQNLLILENNFLCFNNNFASWQTCC